MNPTLALILTVILLVGNAFFVGAEFAITSSRTSQLEPLAAEGNSRARTALWAVQHISEMLATAQLGVTLCSTGLGVIAEPALAHLLAAPLHAVGLGAEVAHGLAVVVALLLVVTAHVVLGEMVPKNVSISMPDKAVLVFAPALVACERVTRPAVSALNGLANAVLKLFGLEPRDEIETAFTMEEVASIVERSRDEGVLKDDSGLVAGALEFSEETAGSVMVPLNKLTCLPEQCTPAQVEAEVTRTGYSRFPVTNEQGKISGYIHLKDVLYASTEEREQPVAPWRLRALVPVRAHDEIEDVLAAMQRTGAHLGWVTNESGQMVGVVFLEDVLEELVGEVRDALQRHQLR